MSVGMGTMLRLICLCWLVIGVLWSSAAVAVEISPASEKKMAWLLHGCWQQETAPVSGRAERLGFFSTHELCFGAGDALSMWAVGGSKYNVEGFDAGGSYELRDGKLIMSGDVADGWFLDRQAVACDVVMSPQRAMRLQHCTGGDTRATIGEAALKDSSYAYIPQDCWSRSTTVICLDNAGWVTTYRGVTEVFDFGGTYTESHGRIRFDAGGPVGEGWVWDDAVVECTRDRDSTDLVLTDCTVPNRSGQVSFELDKER